MMINQRSLREIRGPTAPKSLWLNRVSTESVHLQLQGSGFRRVQEFLFGVSIQMMGYYANSIFQDMRLKYYSVAKGTF